ncbi:hypothetical protein BDN70DRAFT_895750 [Pholiota conissans]|uniref:Uncharacterized protein n=1 Tax=Pholiota conissans TaxID=109636 RepID=A0A9P5Z0E8_9AGAR|nr:hypothetical protein BDN70DRAFT_895750 [Pholiota conissans]
MASDNTGPKYTTYACKCLNVRLSASQPPLPAPEYPRDPQYTPVFVKDDGISVIHPQVTARVPSKGEPIPGTSRYSRFSVLTCLFCGLPVYRVHHTFSPDVEGAEATLLPSEEWVEHEIMKTATGWIDVHKDCIVGDAIPQIQASSHFAPVFSLALPQGLISPPPSPLVDEEQLTQRSPSPEPLAAQYLSHLRPLFLQPPFTSSHPIFVHLASLATQKSQELRAAAEQRISDFVTTETAGIEVKEKELKQQVETLWKNFRDNVQTVQHAQSRGAARPLSRPNINGIVSPSNLSSSVTIRDFAPQPIPLQRPSVSTSAPRVSALSASLATTKFHHPRALQEQTPSPSHSRSPSNDDASVLSPHSLTSTLVTPSRGGGSSILQFVPNGNDDINTQASYRFFLTLDEDMARFKEAQAKKQGTSESSKEPQEAGPSRHRSSPTTNGVKKAKAAQGTSSAVEGTRPEGETTPSRARDKGKRVTFVEPAPIANGEKLDDGTEDTLIFPLEEGTEEDLEQAANNPQHTLPLLDQQTTRPVRIRNPRLHNNSGQETFASLRPSSLPIPSHIRPMRSQPGVDSFSQSMILNLPRIVKRPEEQHATLSTQRPVTENEAAILKLLAADTPSHRGAWTPESKAWQTFTRRQDSKDDIDHSNIPEEEDDDDSNDAGESSSKIDFRGLPASMPVDIVTRIKPREKLSLASYRPTTVLSEEASGSANPPLGPGNKPLSSAAIRKALYTERDRYRAMDPGALDFATEEEDEEEESEEIEAEPVKPEEVGEKGRKHALKIIQARDELPAEGMWRSLA